ncbi:MAG TPA: 1-acyl-sn-glycerol-3-phosphate acyltransferase [Bacteroidales bacterium]
MKRAVVDIEELEKLSSIFRGNVGNQLAKFTIRLFAMDRVNEVYDHSCDYTGSAFAEHLLNDLGVNYRIGNVERLKHLPEGAFITISNHPYGGLDGIMLIDLLAGIRPDYKLMVNQILALVKTMDENFISVIPNTTNSGPTAAGINGIRETISQLQNGHPVGFFPAGAVSMFRFKNMCVRDREWQKSIIKIIQKANLPVLPIRFFDQNSSFFYFLGTLNWRIRSIRMPYEIFNKQKQKPRIGIGELLSAEELAKFADYKSMGSFLRKAIYKMPKPTSYTPRTSL